MNGLGQQQVVMVGINYAPEHTGIAPYTTAAAEHLAERDQVVMHTGIPHYPEWKVPDGYRWQLTDSQRVAGVEVRRHRHFVPRSQDFVRRGLYELTFAAHFAARTVTERPDVVVAVVPSLLSAVAAARLAKRRGARLILWIQDSMGAAATQSGVPGGQLVARTVARLEQRIIRQAEWVFVASNAFRRYVEEAGIPAERVVTLPNWVHIDAPSERPEDTRRKLGWGEHETIVLHTGNMGFKQDLGRVVQAAKLVDPASRVRFVLMGDGSQRAELEAMAQGVPAVEIVDPVAKSDYINVLAAADILLVNEREGVIDMSMPSKLTSYFAAGRPVLASVNHAGGTAVEVRRSRAGILTADQTPEGIVAALSILAEDSELGRTLGRHGQLYAERNLSAQASLEIISGIVGNDISDDVYQQVSAAA